MTTDRKVSRRVALTAAIGLAMLAPTLVTAQTAWPKAKPIRFIVPFTPGSGTDVIGRMVGERLSAALDVAVVVENRPGAGGTLGANQVAKSTPDGYTFLIHSSGHVVNPAIYPNLPYDTLKDFVGVTPLASLPNVLVTAPGKFADVRDLVAKAKASPGTFNYASAGNGSATHMNAEVFRVAAGFQAQHVPFRGTPEAMTETVAGRVDWFFSPLVSALPLIQEGRLQALAVGTDKRSDILPNVPTTVEAGVAGSEYLFWVGMLAPAGTPQAIVDRLNTEISKIMGSDDVKTRLQRLGASALPMSVNQFNSFIASETSKAATVVKAAGIQGN
jgi:tripartite-type tricarboxylate transporter receptor subunit TctC